MSFRRSSLAQVFRSRSFVPHLCASFAVALALVGCGGETDPLSTDTGNPPVIVGQNLQVTPTDAGVRVSGSAGTVPRGARVEVVNLASGDSATTTANSDGSFDVELAGAVTDGYRVYSDLAGQTSSAQLTGGSATDSQAGLAGLQFLLESAEGYMPLANTPVRISFDATTVNISGCNSQSGSWSLCDGRLCVSELSRTEIGCPAALDAQDVWFSNFFTSSPLVTQSGARLILEGTDASLTFLDREVADPDRPLVGPTWRMDTIIRGNGASAGASQSTDPTTLTFQPDGQLVVFVSCNTGTGPYTASNGTLTLSEISYSFPPCKPTGDPAVAAHVYQVLAPGDVAYQIDARRLTLTRQDVGLSATTD